MRGPTSRHAVALLLAGLLAGAWLSAACGSDGNDEVAGGDSDRSGGVPLVVSLELPESSAPAGGPIPMTVAVENAHDAPLTIARPAIVPTLVFLHVEREDGERVGFDGPYLRLRPLGRDDFVELAPGERTAHDFDLADYYDLAPGKYRVSAAYRNPQDGSEAGVQAVIVAAGRDLRSDPVALEVR